MATGRIPPYFFALMLLVLALFAVPFPPDAIAAPTIDIQFGFNGHVMPERYAPMRLRIRGFDADAPARIRVEQALGNAWRDTATVTHEPDLTIRSDGTYSASIPIYEPLNPIRAVLLTADGIELAVTETALRAGRRLEPFPVVYGTYPEPSGDAFPYVTAGELPTSWASYDAVQSLWIEAPPPSAAWTAIARWVTAGGSIVVMSGPDYFRLDTPALRQLLPLEDPKIASLTDGTQILAGSPRPGVVPYVTREMTPLLLGWTVGAGHVALLTLRPTDLTADERARTREAIPDASMPSLQGLSESLLGDLPLEGPTHLSALLLIGLGVGSLGASVALAKWKPRRGLMGAVVLFGMTSVWSGFHSEPSHTEFAFYSITTSVQLSMACGINIDLLSFYTLDPSPHHHALGGAQLPVQAGPSHVEDHPIHVYMPQPSAVPATYDHLARPGSVIAGAANTAQKTFYSYSAASAPMLRLHVNRTTREAVIDHRGSTSLIESWLLDDGRIAEIGLLKPGTHGVPLPTAAARSSAQGAGEERSTILRRLGDVFPLQEGVWLVGWTQPWSEVVDDTGRKVRHQEIYVVRGETS